MALCEQAHTTEVHEAHPVSVARSKQHLLLHDSWDAYLAGKGRCLSLDSGKEILELRDDPGGEGRNEHADALEHYIE